MFNQSSPTIKISDTSHQQQQLMQAVDPSAQIKTAIQQTLPNLKLSVQSLYERIFGKQSYRPQIMVIIDNAVDYFGSNILKNYLQAIYSVISNAIKQVSDDNESRGLRQMEDEPSQVKSSQFTSNSFPNQFQKESQLGIQAQAEVLENQTKRVEELKLLKQKQFIDEPIAYKQNDEQQIDEQAYQIVRPYKKAKKTAFYQHLSKLRRFHQQLLFDIVESFDTKKVEEPQNGGVDHLLQFVQKQLQSIINILEKRLQNNGLLAQFVESLNAMKFTINGQLRSELFYEFYWSQDRTQKIHYYKPLKAKLRFSQSYLIPKIQLFRLEQILDQVGIVSKQELKELEESFKEWAIGLQRQTWKYQSICYKHRGKIHYLSENQIMKDKIYLCNQCLSDEQQTQQQNREIVCQRHRKSIKYQISSKLGRQFQQQNQKQGQKQKFICEQCLFYNHHRYDLVCCCHYQPIAQLCIQQHCIEIGEYTLCQICQQNPNGKHVTHRKIKFNFEALMEQFGLEDTINIQVYEKELIKVKEMLKLNPLQKIRIAFAEKTISTIRLLESFAVYDQAKASERINSFMSGGKREDLMVLKGVQSLKQELLSETEKVSYLEAFNFVLEGELLEMFQSISKIIFHSCKKISQLKNTNKNQVIAELNNKYEQISEIESDNKIIIFPTRLSNISPINHSRIQRITIVKENQAQRDEQIGIKLRNKKGKMFKQQIRRQMHKKQVGAQQREAIQLCIQSDKHEFGRLINNLKEEDKFYKYKTTIESLQKTYKQIQKQFQAKLRECLPWSLVESKEFSRLRVLHIEYNPKYSLNQFETEEYYSYQIDAFELFEFINGNPKIEQIILKGVKISSIQQFIQTLNPNQASSKPKAHRLWRDIKLTLHSTYELHPYIINHQFNVSTFSFRLSALSHFRKQFQSLSDMTVVIIYDDEDWGNHLERLLQCLREIINIKIDIHSIQQPFLLKPLLKGLSSFEEITSLAFHGINFSHKESAAQFPPTEKKPGFSCLRSSLSPADVSAMDDSLSLLFKNNTVTYIKLDNCSNFPVLPCITTLRSIYLNWVSFWRDLDLGEFINANRQLRVLHIMMCQIEEETLNQLQYLRADITQNGVCFGPISSLSPSKLKYLQLNNFGQINPNSLKPIFSKLAHLTQLKLWKFDFGYQLLSAVPSNSLEEISISSNITIKDSDLQLMDCKWPYLREIELISCPYIIERIFWQCKFKGLMKISVGGGNVVSLQGRKYLRGRGVIV